MYRAAKLLSLMSTGFLAGVFTYAFFAIIPAWNEVSREVHFTYRVALMWHNAIVMQSIMLVGILAPLWWAWMIRAMPVARACAVGCKHHEFDHGAGHALRKCAYQPARQGMANRTPACKLPGATA